MPPLIFVSLGSPLELIAINKYMLSHCVFDYVVVCLIILCD